MTLVETEQVSGGAPGDSTVAMLASPPIASTPTEAEGRRWWQRSLIEKLGVGLALSLVASVATALGVAFWSVMDDGLAARYAPEPCMDVAVLTKDIDAEQVRLTHDLGETRMRVLNVQMARGRAEDAVDEARLAPLVTGYAEEGAAKLAAARERLETREGEVVRLQAEATAREAALAALISEKTERLRGQILCPVESADRAASSRGGA